MNFLVFLTACHAHECRYRRVFNDGYHIPFELAITDHQSIGYATAAAAAGADLPADRIMDGVDLTPYVAPDVTPDVTGIERTSGRTDMPHEYLFFRGGAAQAVRDERWKLVVSAPPEAARKEWLFDLTAEGERVDLLAEHPEVAARLRGVLEAHNEAQAEPLWPWATASAVNVDRDLSQDDQAEDEFAYSPN